MKNITKNLISVLALITIFSVIGANVSLAAVSKTVSSHVASSSTSSSRGGGGVRVLSAPTIVSNTVTTTSTTATFNGSVNPNESPTLAWFETLSSGPFQTQNIGSGTLPATLASYTLTGLAPNTSYSFKIVASNAIGITDGNWVSFTTAASSANTPTIVSETYTVTSTTATFSGSVKPNAPNTLAWFETLSGGPYQTQNIGGGTSAVTLVSYTLTGLTPSTTYKFKVVSANANGITDGNWVSFTTTATGNCTTPIISAIDPNHVTAGAGTTPVTITSSNSAFISGTSSAEIDGSPRTTNVTSSTSLKMTLTASDVASVGTKSITVTNGSGCESNALTFTINHTGGGGGGGGGGSHYYASVITQNAGNISNISAILNGTVNPNGHLTTAWFEYGTSASLGNETVHVNQGSASSASALAQSITNLSANTIYYFRAVANNTYGTIKGNIFSFQTLAKNTNGAVTTVQATGKTSTSAKLNGIFINRNGTSASGHFEYGKTASLGSSTANKDLGTSSSVSFSNVVTNLAPNTIYYFRAVAVSQGLTYNGNILVFQTPKTGTATPATPAETDSVVTTKSSMLKITTGTDDVATGDEIIYLVTFKNTSKKDFENAKIIVQLPKEVDFVESNFGKEESDNTVVFDPGILISDQVGSMTIKGKVNSKALSDSILITTAIMSYNLAGSDEEKDEIAYVTNHVTTGSGLEANPLFGANFLPTTFLGWLALVLVALGLVVVGKKVYENYALKTSRTGTADHIDHLPM